MLVKEVKGNRDLKGRKPMFEDAGDWCI